MTNNLGWMKYTNIRFNCNSWEWSSELQMLAYKPQLQFHHLYWFSSSVALTPNWKRSSESSGPATNFLYPRIIHHPWGLDSIRPCSPIVHTDDYFQTANSLKMQETRPKCYLFPESHYRYLGRQSNSILHDPIQHKQWCKKLFSILIGHFLYSQVNHRWNPTAFDSASISNCVQQEILNMSNFEICIYRTYGHG